VKHIHIYAPLLVALSSTLSAWAGQDSVASPDKRSSAISVEEAVSEARLANPEIAIAVRRLSLAELKTSTARSLDDPMLMIRDWGTPIRKPWDLNQAQEMFMLQQSFPGRQKRDLRARIAGDEVAQAREDLETIRQQITAEVRKVCSDLLRNADEMRVHDHQATLLKEAVSAALIQYTTGKAPQADVLRSQMATTKLNEHLIELQEDEENSRAQLNTLLGRRPDGPLALSGGYVSITSLPSLEDLKSAALVHRPELAALRQEITRSEHQSELTHLAIKPDFTVAAGYMLMPTGSAFRNAYMAEVTMNLPWLNRDRHDDESKQADAATAVSRAELEARASAVYLEIRQAQVQVLAAQRRVKLYRDTLLPQADAAFKASSAAYQNNRSDFLNLIDSQNLLLDIQTAYYKAAAEGDAGLAQLERAVGAPLSELQRPAAEPISVPAQSTSTQEGNIQ
jgi:outer membrane protein TolC